MQMSHRQNSQVLFYLFPVRASPPETRICTNQKKSGNSANLFFFIKVADALPKLCDVSEKMAEWFHVPFYVRRGWKRFSRRNEIWREFANFCVTTLNNVISHVKPFPRPKSRLIVRRLMVAYVESVFMGRLYAGTSFILLPFIEPSPTRNQSMRLCQYLSFLRRVHDLC